MNRLLTSETAAVYCGLKGQKKAEAFRKYARQVLGVKPLPGRKRPLLWDIKAIDNAIDKLQGLPHQGGIRWSKSN